MILGSNDWCLTVLILWFTNISCNSKADPSTKCLALNHGQEGIHRKVKVGSRYYCASDIAVPRNEDRNIAAQTCRHLYVPCTIEARVPCTVETRLPCIQKAQVVVSYVWKQSEGLCPQHDN